MIFLKFFRQQDWRYAVPCIVFLFLFQNFGNYFSEFPGIYEHQLAFLFVFATGFLICYSLKFAGKYDNQFIDRLKLFFYFCYFTIVILSINRYEDLYLLIYLVFPWCLFYLYFYTLLIFYKRDMEEKGKPISRPYWISILVVQTIIILFLIAWGITQRVEAEKQKTLSAQAQKEAELANMKSRRYQEQLLQQK